MSAPSRRPASAATKASSRLRGPLARRLGAEFAEEPHARRKRAAAGDLARRLAAPEHEAAGRKREGLVGFAGEFAEPAGDLGRDRALDRRPQRLVLQRGRAALGLEMNAGEPADECPSTVTAPSAATPPSTGPPPWLRPASGRWCAGR